MYFGKLLHNKGVQVLLEALQGLQAPQVDARAVIVGFGDYRAELERLARAQVDHIREEIPRLLNELKPHFDTPAEAEAKQRYEAGLKALRARLDRETLALLDSLGLERASG